MTWNCFGCSILIEKVSSSLHLTSLAFSLFILIEFFGFVIGCANFHVAICLFTIIFAAAVVILLSNIFENYRKTKYFAYLCIIARYTHYYLR